MGFNDLNPQYCKYCGKECKSINSLKQHEIRCSKNENRITCKHTKRGKYKNKGYKWMNNGEVTKFVNPSDFSFYVNLGWEFGVDKNRNERLSKSLLSCNKPIGKCKDIDKENERRQKISNSMKGNENWKNNKKRGNSRQGKYKGIECDSTWELAFLVYHIEHKLNIKRCTRRLSYIFEGNTHIYTPDFETDFGIIEIKGRKDKKAIVKQQNFPEIKVIDKYEIGPYLKYVKDKYGEEFWKTLYD